MVKSQKAAKASLGAEAEAQAPSPTGREKPKVAAKDGSEAFYKRWQQTSFQTAKLWIPDDTIDVWKFPFVQSQRTTMKQLALEPALDSVHYVDVSESAVPAFVHNLAAKSSKLIPDAKPNTIRQVMVSFDSFMRSTILAHFFSGRRESDDNNTRKTSRGNKSCLPKLGDDMTCRFGIYSRLTQAEILDSWPGSRNVAKNFPRLDIKAVRWLEAHASTTKNR